ncbi:MAG TPA: DUF2169 domain-containing protein [Polyangia bacterium]|jgi:hypothetical protein|nr:DUF2169 domain-containing protein [Polyangia bacterium]
MELDNQTRFPAGIFRSVIDENRFAAAVVARVTFDLTPSDQPRVAAEQPWIVSAAPWTNEHGQMDGDEVFYRGGVDIFLFGKARAVGRMVSQLDVIIEVGSFRRQVVVIGDRAWVRSVRKLVATSPAPFAAIPLTLAHAFGGQDQWDGLDVPYPDNPAGRGFALDEKSAEGRLLPNIEDPGRRIVNWDDRPDPVGLGVCPSTSGLRLRNGIVLDDQHQIQDLKPTLYNAAFPEMIAERVGAGDPVRVTGVSRSGLLAFRVPDLRLMVQLGFGAEIIERPLAIDQLGIEAEHDRFFITYRYPFRYVMHPLQKRWCRLLLAPPEVPAKEPLP